MDLAALKTPPGEYLLTLHGIAVTKYSPNPEALNRAKEEQKKFSEEFAALTAAAKDLGEKVSVAPAEEKAEAINAAKVATQKQKAAEAALAEATKRLKALGDAAGPKDILDLTVSEPIRISVKAPPTASAPSPKEPPASVPTASPQK